MEFKIEPFSIDEILKSHIAKADLIASQNNIKDCFEEYLKHGCYPFYMNSSNEFLLHLRDTIQLTIDSDIPSVIQSVEKETHKRIKELLELMSNQTNWNPYIKSISKLISESDGIRLLYLLDKASILKLLNENLKSYKHLSRQEIVLFNNPNLLYAYCPNPDKRTVLNSFLSTN